MTKKHVKVIAPARVTIFEAVFHVSGVVAKHDKKTVLGYVITGAS